MNSDIKSCCQVDSSKVMDGSCQPKPLCWCRSVSKLAEAVKKEIESCIQNYMSLEETANHFKEKHQISHDLTKTIWEQLQKENPDFFTHYYSRCKLARQIKKFNDLLAEHALMSKLGYRDNVGASRAYNTEILHTQLNGSFTADNAKPSPASLALSDANVTQSQIPYDQQNQLHHYSTSVALPDANGLSVSQLPIPNDQCHWPTSDDLYLYESLGAPTMAPPATDFAYDYPGLAAYTPAATDQFDDLSYSGAQTGAAAATMPQDPSTFGFRGDTGHNGLSTCQDTELKLLARQLYTQSNEQIHCLDGHYPPNYGRRNELQHGGGSNGFHNGEGIYGFHNGGGINGQQNGGGSNGFHNVEGSNGLQNGGSNQFHNGGGINGQQNGEGSNGFHNGEGGNGLQNGGSNQFHNGEGSIGLQNGGGSNGFHNGGSSGMQNGGGSNRFQNGGGSIDQQFYNNFDTNQPLRLQTSVDEQQARGVKRYHPDSEALNIPDISDGTSKTANKQRNLQKKEQRLRSLKKKKPYQSEETKEIFKQ